MTTSPLLLARKPTPVPALVALVAVVAALALGGAWLAITAFTTGHDDAGQPHPDFVGERITTSYGSFTVQHVEDIGGLTSNDLAGVTHGIQNLVLSDSAQVETAVLFTNESGDSVQVSPSQFRLVVDGAADPVEPTGSTIRPLLLQPGASLEASMTFVVKQTGARLSVTYADPGGALITVPAGVLGQAPPDTGNGHSH
jgi:hypothetical protein